jgi:hypothetical protein
MNPVPLATPTMPRKYNLPSLQLKQVLESKSLLQLPISANIERLLICTSIRIGDHLRVSNSRICTRDVSAHQACTMLNQLLPSVARC